MNTFEPVRSTNLETRNIRVLCVDDNQDLADSYHALLLMQGFDVRTCYNGIDAIEEAQRFNPDICLIDLNMPRMSGDEVARRIIANSGDQPPVLIAVTAMNGDLFRVVTKLAGFRRHLVKPVDPKELVRVLQTEFQSASL